MNNAVTGSWSLNDKLSGEYELLIMMRAGYLYPKVISEKYNIEIKKTLPNKE